MIRGLRVVRHLFHLRPMRRISASIPTPEALRHKALLALEEVVQECRYRTPRRTLGIRFALAYLWAYAPRDPRPFDELWRQLGAEKSPWSFSCADNALSAVYVSLGVRRDD